MEPMTLGSPGGSPAANTSYLPSFLMGEQEPATPRNALSPNKAGRNISFAASPLSNSPQDFNRSAFGQKSLFGNFNSPATHNTTQNFGNTSMQNHNTSISGPPTQGLFDSLRQERQQLPTPVSVRQLDCSTGGRDNVTSYGFNVQPAYGGNDSFNVSARNIMSPLGPGTPTLPGTLINSGVNNMQARPTEFWVTVFGFPPSAAATILQHFSKCGTILDKIFPSQNGNWVHIKYSSRLECDKALSFNEKIIGNIMIGVTQCHDNSVIGKENLSDNRTPTICGVRPLTQSAFKNVQDETSVVASPNTPQRSSGIVNKAMDLLFGW